MSSKKVVVVIVFLVLGIIGASLLIKPKDERAIVSKSDNNSNNTPTEKDDAEEIKAAMDKMYDLYNLSNVIDGDVMKEGFRKGINMGDMLEAPNEGDWGVTFDPNYFRLIKEQGFDFVRIPIKWSAHCDVEKLSDSFYDIAPGGVIEEIFDSDFLERVDYIIQCALDNELGVVINVHNFDEVMDTPINSTIDYDRNHHPLWALWNIWQFLAYHYQTMPDNVLFEILNEPCKELIMDYWSNSQLEIYKMIRQTNPKRGIILQAGAYGGYSELDKLWVPKDDKNVIISFHFYDPITFTRQSVTGEKWTNDEIERKRIDAVFNNIKSFAEATGLPIFLGEFGVSSEADMESRVMWTRCVRETAEKYGFTWCYWEFCSGFGIFDSQTMTFNEILKSALLDGKKSDFNTEKGNVKVTYKTDNNNGFKTMSEFLYQRKMNIRYLKESNLLLYDSNNNTQIVSVKGAEDGGYILLPLSNINYSVNSSGTGKFSKNTIELTVININDSISDLRISLTQGNEKEVILYDNDHFDEATTGAYDKKTIITLKMDNVVYDFTDNYSLFLKVYIETLPERKDNYDRTGTLEFVEMQVY